MKLAFDLKQMPVGKIKKIKLSLILWVVLAVIAVMTGLVVYNELSKVTAVQTDQDTIFDRIVRVNLNQFNAVEKRLSENSSFQPVPVPGASVFGPAPKPVED